eukprot:11952-Heterococcus_DN1.PRE.1
MICLWCIIERDNYDGTMKHLVRSFCVRSFRAAEADSNAAYVPEGSSGRVCCVSSHYDALCNAQVSSG